MRRIVAFAFVASLAACASTWKARTPEEKAAAERRAKVLRAEPVKQPAISKNDCTDRLE